MAKFASDKVQRVVKCAAYGGAGMRRSVEQGPRLRGCVRGAECRRTATNSNPGAPPGSDPHTWGPSSAVRCAPLAGMRSRSQIQAHFYEFESRHTSRVRSPYMGPLFRRAVRRRAWECAPDPVRVALVREGAHEAANDVHETGRMRLLPQTGLRLTGRSRPRTRNA